MYLFVWCKMVKDCVDEENWECVKWGEELVEFFIFYLYSDLEFILKCILGILIF